MERWKAVKKAKSFKPDAGLEEEDSQNDLTSEDPSLYIDYSMAEIRGANLEAQRELNTRRLGSSCFRRSTRPESSNATFVFQTRQSNEGRIFINEDRIQRHKTRQSHIM